MNKYRPNSEAAEPASLPKISEAVLRRFLNNPPDFETLYGKLKQDDERLAGWLLAVTERVAPADAREKERYGKVALLLYGMLIDQQSIDTLAAQFNASEIPEPVTPIEVRNPAESRPPENS